MDERMRFWFGGREPQELLTMKDREIEARFESMMEAAAQGKLDAWADSPRRRLALILLLDQFPRNVYRGTARAFENDAKAVQLALDGIQVGADATLDPVERLFFYMPLQHSEDLAVQEESLAASRRLASETPDHLQRQFNITLGYAELHRDIIKRYGRFPHRNAVLGRSSTAEELSYLRNSAERFGQ
jgi:uncharacterized protein (DUF924 family)